MSSSHNKKLITRPNRGEKIEILNFCPINCIVLYGIYIKKCPWHYFDVVSVLVTQTITCVVFFSLCVHHQLVENQPRCRSHHVTMMTLFYFFTCFLPTTFIRSYFSGSESEAFPLLIWAAKKRPSYSKMPSLMQTSLPFRSSTILGMSSHLSCS